MIAIHFFQLLLFPFCFVQQYCAVFRSLGSCLHTHLAHTHHTCVSSAAFSRGSLLRIVSVCCITAQQSLLRKIFCDNNVLVSVFSVLQVLHVSQASVEVLWVQFSFYRFYFLPVQQILTNLRAKQSVEFLEFLL